MLISFSPQRRDDKLTVTKEGDCLVINGDVVDLSVIPDGADLTAEAIDCEWIVGTVRRSSGVLHVTLILPHGADAPESVRFPDDLINPPDGQIAIPGGDDGND